jgi:hypothetical protein
MDEFETPLAGGNLSAVWGRRGDTVRRPTCPWTPAVHPLLHHRAVVGFDGRHGPSASIPGAVRCSAMSKGGAGLPGPGRRCGQSRWRWRGLLRRLHGATVGFQPPAAAVWRHGAGAPGGGEVICHNDVAHYNTVFVAGRPVAFIGRDPAAPGPRVSSGQAAGAAYATQQPEAAEMGPGWSSPAVLVWPAGWSQGVGQGRLWWRSGGS